MEGSGHSSALQNHFTLINEHIMTWLLHFTVFIWFEGQRKGLTKQAQIQEIESKPNKKTIDVDLSAEVIIEVDQGSLNQTESMINVCSLCFPLSSANGVKVINPNLNSVCVLNSDF